MKWTAGCTGILTLLLVSQLFSQHVQWLFDLNGENSGHTVCRFLTLPSSATTLGRGEASAAGTGTALDLPGYTAYTAAADRYRFSFSHLEWLMGMRKEYLGALFPVLDVGTFGFYSVPKRIPRCGCHWTITGIWTKLPENGFKKDLAKTSKNMCY